MSMRLVPLSLCAALCVLAASDSGLHAMRDKQDRAALEQTASRLASEAQKRQDPAAFYRAAVAYSNLAEVALEMRDKNAARSAAESGIKLAEQAVAKQGNNSEYRRVLGTLCGQVIPANVLAGMRYGRCALDEISKAIELNPKSSDAYMSRGVGNYYLPPTFGGGVEKAIADFRKAIELDGNSADAHLWLGIALRKANRNSEARAALERSLKLNPARIWTKQQLDKTPAH